MSQLVAQKLILFFEGPGEHPLSGGSNDKWEERTKTGSPGPGSPNQMCHCSQWPIKIMDDAWARQMEIMEIIFFPKLLLDGLHFCPPVLSKTSSFVSAPLCGFVVVIFLWWLIRPARPHSTHRYLHWLMPEQDFLSRLGSPNLQNVSQYQLPPLLTQKVPSSLPGNYCCRKPPLLHHGSHNNCCW